MYVVGIVILCLVEIIKFLMIFRAWPRTQLLTGSQTPPGDNYSILSRSYTNNKLLLVCNRIAVLLAITLTGSIAGSLPYWLSLSQGVQRDRCPIGYHSHREYRRIAVLLAITFRESIAGSLSNWLLLSERVQQDRCPIGYHSQREYSRIAVLLAVPITGSIA